MKSQNIDTDEINILQIVSTIWHRKWLILAIIITSIFISIYCYYSIPNTYRSNINIQVNLDSKGGMSSILSRLPLGSNKANNYGSEIELIKSRKLLSEVVDDLNLNESQLNIKLKNKEPEPLLPYIKKINTYLNELFSSLATKKNKYESLSKKILITKKLQSMLSVSYSDSGKFLTIKIESYRPELSTRIVNSIAKIYMQHKEKQIKEQQKNTLNWLSSELASIKKDIMRSENELIPLSGNEDSPDIRVMLKLKEDELNSLSSKKNELEQKIEIDEIHYKNLEGVTEPTIILESPLIKSTPQIEKAQTSISDAENKLLELSLKYGPKHPSYIIAKENLYNEKSILKRQVRNLLNTYISIFEIETKKIKSLEKLLSKNKIELQKLRQSENIYLKKLREIETYRSLYNMTLKRFQEAQSINNLKQEIATVLDYSLVEDAQKTSRQNLISTMIVFLGFFISIFISLFLGIIDQGIHSKDDLNNLTEAPILTNLPKVKNRKKIGQSYNFIQDKIYLESIYRLRTRLRTIDKNKKMLSITSAIPKEGKSTTVLHLAKALSELEKVLVIDIDFRRHSITKDLNISNEKSGLSDIILNKAKFSDAIIRNSKEGFDILGVGTALDYPNALLSSDMMGKILMHLRNHYDRIIIETPPVQLFSDAEVVSKLVDATLLIVKADYTKKKDLTATIEQLEQININILGIILNQTVFTSKEKHYDKYIQNSKA
ncbi:GumC family protein [Marinomonas transparens]|uniref:non-specific protein-tyrosine kinase n=1 Tax=Marinomonas transparens TaxID=2795388 RepID=A0A934JTN2_9GAMM|nr:tyrosine-protein kinase family protein [Marinomonas transparens]MBJ7538116.1 polysaccharide biosynthesis tyrosine autokinase [Marinomonas transparens]